MKLVLALVSLGYNIKQLSQTTTLNHANTCIGTYKLPCTIKLTQELHNITQLMRCV